jgi:hypothetical protein
MPSKTCGDKRPQRASASKAKSSVLSQLSGLENVVFNDFIDDELDSEDATCNADPVFRYSWFASGSSWGYLALPQFSKPDSFQT